MESGIRESPLCGTDRRVQLQIARWDGLGEGPTLNDQIGLGGHSFVGQSVTIAPDGLEVARQTSLAQAKTGQGGPRGLVSFPPPTLGLGPFA